MNKFLFGFVLGGIIGGAVTWFACKEEEVEIIEYRKKDVAIGDHSPKPGDNIRKITSIKPELNEIEEEDEIDVQDHNIHKTTDKEFEHISTEEYCEDNEYAKVEYDYDAETNMLYDDAGDPVEAGTDIPLGVLQFLAEGKMSEVCVRNNRLEIDYLVTRMTALHEEIDSARHEVLQEKHEKIIKKYNIEERDTDGRDT